MAQSRIERIGTIFSRITGLMRGGALKEENVPLWYEVYAAFPPNVEPKFGRKPSRKQIQNIFYAEDYIRAKLHEDLSSSIVDLKSDGLTQIQEFLAIYGTIKETDITDEEAYEKALEIYISIFRKERKIPQE